MIHIAVSHLRFFYRIGNLTPSRGKCLHAGGVIPEVFINRKQLTDKEWMDFLAAAIQTDDHRTDK